MAPRVFPVVRSLLSPTALAQALDVAYGLDRTRRRLIKATSRDIYRIESREGPKILAVYRHDRRTMAEIEAELDVLEHLEARGLAVATAVPTRTGERLIGLPAPEGRRFAVLYRFVAGLRMAWCTATSSRPTSWLGQTAA